MVLFGLTALACAQTVIEQSFTNLNMTVPDNDPSGVADVRTIRGHSPGSVVMDVNVSLKLRGAGARNGDLYATLEHQSGYSVLLNRVGRRENDPIGYQDPGLEVTFDDEAANGDIHVYRVTLFGNHSTPVGQLLASWWSGDWAPDGRNVDPGLVRDGSARQASLSSMKGLPVDGRWRLFIADVAQGGVSQLQEWSLQIRSTTNLNALTLELQNATIRAEAEPRVITIPVTVKGELSIAGGADTAFTGAVTGPGLLTKNGAGDLVLSGANTFSGGIQLAEGALVLGSDLATGLGPISLKGGAIQAKGGARRIDNAVSLAGKLSFAKGDRLELAGSVTLQGNSPLKVENETEIAGDIQESEPGASFLKSGNGKLTLSGVNTFSGGIALEEGTLAIGNDRALGTGSLTLKGGKVEASGGDRKLANSVKLAGSVGISGGITFTGDLTLQELATLEVEGTTTLSGPLKEEKPGTGFVKKGNGTLVLEGANTISGGVNIEEGELSVNNLGGSATGSGPVEIGGKAMLSGKGSIAGNLSLAAGATLDPGASPGRLTTGAQFWADGVKLVWEMADATGGDGLGWDTLQVNGTLTLGSTPANPCTIRLVTLGSDHRPAPAAHFDPTQDYVWKVAQTTVGVRGFDARAVRLDTNGFANGLSGGRLQLEVRGNDLVLVYAGERPARVTRIERVDANLRLVIQGVAGQSYRLEAADSLPPANWVGLGTSTANSTGELEFMAPLSGPAARFFRVVSLAGGGP